MARVDIVFDEHGQPVLDVVLSSKNLVVLLSKLWTPGSLCRIENGRVPAGFAGVRISGESDEVHYNAPGRGGVGPGEMHPIAEAVLAAVRTTLAARETESLDGTALQAVSGAGDGDDAAQGPRARDLRRLRRAHDAGEDA
jgi:hypothetical protein